MELGKEGASGTFFDVSTLDVDTDVTQAKGEAREYTAHDDCRNGRHHGTSSGNHHGNREYGEAADNRGPRPKPSDEPARIEQRDERSHGACHEHKSERRR